MMAKLLAAAVLYWLLKPPATKATPAVEGTVDIGDDWTATFNSDGTGRWSDDYRLKDPGDIP